MEEALVWKVLGLEPTKDETQLKNRYHELLRTVNPEMMQKDLNDCGKLMRQQWS